MAPPVRVDPPMVKVAMMTNRGTRARWTTAALIAPTAAALFTGTPVWAAGHQPVTTTKAAPKATATVDPTVVALRQAVKANEAQVAALRKTVQSLKKQADALAKGQMISTKKKSSSSSSSSTSSSSSSSSTSSSSSSSSSSNNSNSSSYQAPPSSQGSTGASGSP